MAGFVTKIDLEWKGLHSWESDFFPPGHDDALHRPQKKKKIMYD